MTDEQTDAELRAVDPLAELLALVATVAVYCKAFLEALGKRRADAGSDLCTRYRKEGTTTEAKIGLDGGASANIVVTADMPDEARLALLDLDVTADEVRGRELRWDSDTSAWRPADNS
jgi:hypothetical protein